MSPVFIYITFTWGSNGTRIHWGSQLRDCDALNNVLMVNPMSRYWCGCHFHAHASYLNLTADQLHPSWQWCSLISLRPATLQTLIWNRLRNIMRNSRCCPDLQIMQMLIWVPVGCAGSSRPIHGSSTSQVKYTRTLVPDTTGHLQEFYRVLDSVGQGGPKAY